MKFSYPLKQLALGAALILGCSAATAMSQSIPPPAAPAENMAAKLEQPKPVTPPAAKAVVTPALHSVRDVELGMTVDEVRKKLGKPEVQDDTGLVFSLSGGDSVQIGLDADKHVRGVAEIYAAGSKNAPTLKDVFGSDAEDVAGDTYKMERYPEAGYWVSYSRSNSKDKPIVVVTMRKIT